MDPAPPPPLEPAHGAAQQHAAWGCLIANLAVPGLGTIIARRRGGWIQLFVSQLGFALTLLWGVWYALVWIRDKRTPPDVGPYFWLGALGAFLFMASWFWALATSLAMLRPCKR